MSHFATFETPGRRPDHPDRPDAPCSASLASSVSEHLASLEQVVPPTASLLSSKTYPSLSRSSKSLLSCGVILVLRNLGSQAAGVRYKVAHCSSCSRRTVPRYSRRYGIDQKLISLTRLHKLAAGPDHFEIMYKVLFFVPCFLFLPSRYCILGLPLDVTLSFCLRLSRDIQELPRIRPPEAYCCLGGTKRSLTLRRQRAE